MNSRGGRKTLVQFGNTHLYIYRIIYKQNSFEIISRGVQGCTPMDFQYKILGIFFKKKIYLYLLNYVKTCGKFCRKFKFEQTCPSPPPVQFINQTIRSFGTPCTVKCCDLVSCIKPWGVGFKIALISALILLVWWFICQQKYIFWEHKH